MKPVQRGIIINTASVVGIIGGCPHAYTCSKHAIVGLTKNTALDLGRYGIRVNCVSPHAVPTRMSKTYLGLGEEDKFDVYSDLKSVEVRPEDVADAFLYLASDESSVLDFAGYFTAIFVGITLHLNISGYHWCSQPGSTGKVRDSRRFLPSNYQKKADSMGKGECHIDYMPAPRITEADKTRDRKSQKSLQRALDRNVYILIYGTTVYGRNLVWHFPKKAYELEEFNILPLKCKESRLAMLEFNEDRPYACLILEDTLRRCAEYV
nr:secoisolariciresinol dehydrogenase-like [Ipomoea batatas]